MTTYTATFSPDDNKLRLYASSRLDAELYAAVRAAGFIWAPKQDLFVAPMWTPSRADFLINLCGQIDDEDSSLVDRAEERADRFDVYSEKRSQDAERAHSAVAAISENIPLGQPILVGHHSEKHARKDAQRIENGMKKVVSLWETSQYWTRRAAGALHHAKYKELPAVRARRIKGIQADKRKKEKMIKEAEEFLTHWQKEGLTLDLAKAIACYDRLSKCFTLTEYPREAPASQYEGPMGIWSALEDGIINEQQAAAIAIPTHKKMIASAHRWIEHYNNRLAYETAMLGEQGGSDLLKPKTRPAQLPLCNYRAPEGILTKNSYHRGQLDLLPQVEMTKAEYANIHTDYKGTATVENSHRVRVALIKSHRVCVFITDSKTNVKPEVETVAAVVTTAPEKKHAPAETIMAKNADQQEAELRAIWTEQGVTEERQNDIIADINAKAQPGAQIGPFTIKAQCNTEPTQNNAETPRLTPEVINTLRSNLKQGVQVVTAPQLFPTPTAIAQRMVELADIQPGDNVADTSAGTGRIIGAMGGLMFGHNPECGSVTAVEINRTLADRLTIDFPLTTVYCADFLALTVETMGRFDKIIINPPFVNGADILHIRHARLFLKPRGKLIAICANGSRQNDQLKPLADTWEVLPPNTFAESGTNVNTVLLTIRG